MQYVPKISDLWRILATFAGVAIVWGIIISLVKVLMPEMTAPFMITSFFILWIGFGLGYVYLKMTVHIEAGYKQLFYMSQNTSKTLQETVEIQNTTIEQYKSIVADYRNQVEELTKNE